ncbi:MAG TPA: hypothetical protein VF389_11720 [Woeseiaceae bacterium]
MAETDLEELLDNEPDLDAEPDAQKPDPDIQGEPEAKEPPKEEAKEDEPKQTEPPPGVLQERDKRKAVEAELQQLRQRLEQPQQPEQIPDVFENPEAYHQYMMNQISAVRQEAEQRVLNERLNLSQSGAEKEHGKETVQAAYEWFQGKAAQNPALIQEVIGHRDPYDYAVQLYKRETTFGQADPSDYQEFLAWKSGQKPEPQKAPETTATSRSMGGRKGPQWDGPTPLNQILDP